MIETAQSIGGLLGGLALGWGLIAAAIMWAVNLLRGRERYIVCGYLLLSAVIGTAELIIITGADLGRGWSTMGVLEAVVLFIVFSIIWPVLGVYLISTIR
jgi:hypothetical protein